MTDTSMSETEQLDEILWGCLNLWDCYINDTYARASEKEREKLKCMDAVDWFCANARNRLEVLRKQGECPPKLFEPLLRYK